MLELYIQAVRTDDAGAEEPAATRERLKDLFPRGATRRMTQLGMLIGATLADHHLGADDTLIYTSSFGESRALEAYLDSFPSASPTLFQTSIHPSAVQQFMIGRQQALRRFFPITGRGQLVAQALRAAALAPTPRAVICGGEERGTWLLANRVASERSFGFSLVLSRASEGSCGAVRLEPCEPQSTADESQLTLSEFFDALHLRRALAVKAAPGLHLTLTWS